jgi:2-keto-4-pentenoate hydratase/2-oxohepta-3-ene-1,7-dioic acid hydratase in catechol pathway
MKTLLFQGREISPSKVVCIGRNYVEHIHELGNEIPENMVVFNKPNSAISDSLRFFSEYCRFESEICFLIQKGVIAGVGIGLDLTEARIQNHLKEKGLPWERAKGFDGAAVLSDFVPLSGKIESLEMKLYINDVLTQHASYDLMMYKPSIMIEEIQSFMSLEEGDVVMSGTPKGVGNYKVGDRFVGQLFCEGRVLLEQRWYVLS